MKYILPKKIILVALVLFSMTLGLSQVMPSFQIHKAQACELALKFIQKHATLSSGITLPDSIYEGNASIIMSDGDTYFLDYRIEGCLTLSSWRLKSFTGAGSPSVLRYASIGAYTLVADKVKLEGIKPNQTFLYSLDYTGGSGITPGYKQFTVFFQSPKNQGTTTTNPDPNRKYWLYITDTQGKDWGTGTTVPLNAKGYKVKAKIEKPDTTAPYKIRVYEQVNGKTTDIPVIAPRSGNPNVVEVFSSKELVFDKLGTYTYFLDKSENGGAFGNVESINITVSDQPTTTTTTGNPNANVNTNTSATFIDLDQVIDSFKNPLEKNTLPELLGTILRIMFALLGMVAVVIIIVAGFRMVLASGNTDQLTKAKQAITWAIVGLIVSLMAFSIVAIVQKLIQG